MSIITNNTWAVKIHKGWSALKHKKKLLATLVIILSIITPTELTISGEFEVYPDRNADIRAPVDAIVRVILVKEGDAVKKGQMLFKLVNPDILAKKQVIRLQLADAKSRYELLVAGARQEEVNLATKAIETAEIRFKHANKQMDQAAMIKQERITQARQLVDYAKGQLDYAENEEQRFIALRIKGIISEQRYSEVEQVVRSMQTAFDDRNTLLKIALADDMGAEEREIAMAEGQLKEMRAKLGILKAGSRSEEVEAALSAVEALEAQRVLVEEELVSMEVLSPEDGIVVTEHLHEMRGQHTSRGEMIAEVYDFSIIKAELLIPEKEIGDIAIGQSVMLKARAYAGRFFEGKVVAIAPRAIDSQDGLRRKMLRVTTVIANPDLLLKPAMTGHGKIYAGERSILNLITRRFMSYLRVEFWSWW